MNFLILVLFVWRTFVVVVFGRVEKINFCLFNCVAYAQFLKLTCKYCVCVNVGPSGPKLLK